MANSFYTFVDRQGNSIFHRYVKDGIHAQDVVTKFPVKFYLKGKGDSRSLFDEPLTEHAFDKISEAKQFLEEYKGVEGLPIYGNDDLSQQFIAHAYPGEVHADVSAFTIVSVDIEVEHDHGFPEPADALNEILTISMKVFNGDSICIATKPKPEGIPDDLIYIECRDEKELISRFIDEWKKINCHILTGWNVYSFDVPYIVNRIKRLMPDLEHSLSPFVDFTRQPTVNPTFNKDGDDSYRILGVTVLDYLELYKKFSPDKQESYKLDHIAQAEGVGQKVSFEEYGNSLMRLYRENFSKFVTYNDVDNRLVELLDNKLQFMSLAIAVANLTKSRYSDSTGTVKIWDNLIYHRALADGKVIPPKRKVDHVDNAGGFVKDVKPGLYRWPVTFDLTSLYPSIARLLNLSPETKLTEPMGRVEMVDRVLSGEVNPADYTADGVCFAINGATFRTDVQGIISGGMEYVFFERKRYKDEMKKAKNELERLKEELRKLESET